MIFPRLTVDAVNRAVTTLDGAAGKSVNVAKVLKTLGQHPLATGFLGGQRGEQVRALLVARGIKVDFVMVDSPTRQCITVIDESARTHTELVEESCPVTKADYERLMKIIRRSVKGCRAVVMSGTITPGGPSNFYFECAKLAREAGAFAVVDAQGAALLAALKAGPELVKPNRAELAVTMGRKVTLEAAAMSAMRGLCERGAKRVIVTAGQDPTLAYDGRNFWKIRSPRIAAINPIGSGDAFTAGLVWRLVRGDDLGEACRWASATAAANALTPMPGEVNRADVERLARAIKVRQVLLPH